MEIARFISKIYFFCFTTDTMFSPFNFLGPLLVPDVNHNSTCNHSVHSNWSHDPNNTNPEIKDIEVSEHDSKTVLGLEFCI